MLAKLNPAAAATVAAIVAAVVAATVAATVAAIVAAMIAATLLAVAVFYCRGLFRIDLNPHTSHSVVHISLLQYIFVRHQVHAVLGILQVHLQIASGENRELCYAVLDSNGM